MGTIVLMMILALLTLVFTPLIASVYHYKLHRTDLMAGDEGED